MAPWGAWVGGCSVQAKVTGRPWGAEPCSPAAALWLAPVMGPDP